MKRERRKPVLIVQHARHEHPAVIRRALETQGIQVQWLHSYLGEEFPKAAEISGMISLGGPMGANDEVAHPWIRTEIDLLRSCVEKGLPVVGVCLGGQMLAKAMGGKIEKNRSAEVGWFPIRLNADGKKDPIMGVAGATPTVYHWHEDTFIPPKEAVLLATSEACPRQAYRIGEKAYGFQFHPEADHQLIHEWLSVEGIDDEILCIRNVHGKKTVQDSDTQRNLALKGEKASLKITAAFGNLFRRREKEGIKNDSYERLESLATQRAVVVIEFEGSNRKSLHLRGTISTLLSIPAGDFVVFQEENRLLWPIRIEDIRAISFA